jgi:hypothetical protein
MTFQSKPVQINLLSLGKLPMETREALYLAAALIFPQIVNEWAFTENFYVSMILLLEVCLQFNYLFILLPGGGSIC